MIITRSPLRISLGGGGTDLPSYYKDHKGFLIAAAIDKYVHITLHKTFIKDMIIKYSKMEKVRSADEVQHPIIREALKLLEVDTTGLEITSMADIPAGSGLGSSGSFNTALLKALHVYKRSIISTHELAEQACHIELDLLNEPIGKQDQYIAAFGGITCFEFDQDGQVTPKPLKLSQDTLYNLSDNLLLFFTGYTRSASNILKDQDTKSKDKDSDMLSNLHFIKDIGFQSKRALELGDLNEFAHLMNEHWAWKQKRSQNISNSEIARLYDYARKYGALGGKLIGAGGGGFMMFYTNDNTKLRKAMNEINLKEVHFKFDFEGTKAVVA